MGRYIENLFGPELDDMIVRLGFKADVPLYSRSKAYLASNNSFHIIE